MCRIIMLSVKLNYDHLSFIICLRLLKILGKKYSIRHLLSVLFFLLGLLAMLVKPILKSDNSLIIPRTNLNIGLSAMLGELSICLSLLLLELLRQSELTLNLKKKCGYGEEPLFFHLSPILSYL